MNTSEDIHQLLQRAERALVGGQFEDCARLAEAVLAQDAINIPAHLFRGVSSHQLGQLDRAVTDLLFVLERQPGNAQASFHLGQALRKSGQFDAALIHLQEALDVQALRPHALFEMARALRGLGKLRKAIDHYKLLLKETPSHADAAANLADLLEKTNQLDEALAWSKRAQVLAPANHAPRLTQARVQRRLGNFETAAGQLRELIESPALPSMSRVIALNQLGQCLDRLGQYAEAFDHFSAANRLQLEKDPAAGRDDKACYGIEMARFLRTWLRDHPPADWSPTPDDEREPPVFLVGFPRSGTTLLDQLLSAHPDIGVIEEQELFFEVRRRWMSAETFPQFHEMSGADIRQARQLYRQARAGAYHDPDARVIVDKLPLNAMYLQLIYRLFPEARVIVAQRDPRDVCLSCFFQTFQLVGAMPYFLDMDDTADYYDAVMALATDALERLPLHTHTVRYEPLIEDLEAQARALIDFLGVSWDERVLEYRQARPDHVVHTPSYQQVSEPIYTRSVGRWRHYETQLAGIAPRLEPWVKAFGYSKA